MKKKWQRIATVFLSCFILLFLSAPAVAAYRLTGHEADDIIAVAEAQVGKAAGEFGFNGAWCGRFLSWCAKQTGSTHVSHNITGGFTAVEYMVEGGLGDFYCFSDSKTNTTGQSIYKYLSTYNKNGHAISKSGMTRVHERDRNSFAPKKGDIIIFLWSDDQEDPQFSHVGFVRSDYDGKGNVLTVEGNTSGKNKNGQQVKSVVACKSRTYRDPQIVGFIRPYYKPAEYNIQISTNAATNITENTAAVAGTYNNPGLLKISEYGIQYGKSSSELELTGALQRNESYPSGTIPLYTLKKLDPGTTYYYRCYVKANGKTYTGDTRSFTTKAIPTVMTGAAASITETSAVISGTYHNPSQYKVTEYGIQYGKSRSNLSFTGSLKRSESFVNGSIPAYALNKLDAGTTYYYRCFIKANGQTYVGETKSFATKAQPKPVAITTSLSSIKLDLSGANTQKLTVTLGGDLPTPCQLIAYSDTKLVSFKWDHYSNGLIANAIISGLKAGSGEIEFQIINSDTKQLYATKKVSVTVTSPTYTIKYDANGGRNAPASQTKSYRKALILSDKIPSRDHYSFVGWAASKNGAAQYKPGQLYTADTHATLYAVWEADPLIEEPLDVDHYDLMVGSDSIKVGESTTVRVQATYSDGSTADVSSSFRITSSAPATASVNGAKIEGVKAGNAIIYAQSSELGVSIRYYVYVVPNEQEDLWIDFTQTTRTEYVDDPAEFEIGYSTNATSDAFFEWSLSDETAVFMPSPDSYTSGASPKLVVRGTEAGDAILTVRVTQQGQTVSASCVIHVEARKKTNEIMITESSVIVPSSNYNQGIEVHFGVLPAESTVKIMLQDTNETVMTKLFTSFNKSESSNLPYYLAISLKELPLGNLRIEIEAEDENGRIMKQTGKLKRYVQTLSNGNKIVRVDVDS